MDAETLESQFVRSLTHLGFSQYEARCYSGMLSQDPLTGYGLSKVTGVPQPKVYETLRKLVARGAAHELAGEPVRFVAVPPTSLLSGLKSEFVGRLHDAEELSKNLVGPEQPAAVDILHRLSHQATVLDAAADVVIKSGRRVYLSASADETESLLPALVEAANRGVDVVLITFGHLPIDHPGIRVFRHASTDGAIYRAHQARHIAMVADSAESLFAVAPDGKQWQGIRSDSAPVIAVVKGYIRHDIDMQQVYADFGADLVAAYGPGLQGLESYRGEPSGRSESDPGNGVEWVKTG